MTFDEYMRAVEDDKYPEDPRVPAGPSFENDNGSILNLAFGDFGGVAIINSTPKSIRSNHYHKTDYHFLAVMVGYVLYYWRPAGSKEEPKMAVYHAGDMFFTPPMVEHAVYSPNGSEIVSMSKLSRRHENHEADLVRVPVIRLEDGDVVFCT